MKFTVIGGGSFTWAFGFCVQFIDSGFARGSRVVLMDIDREALDLVGRAADIYNDSKGRPLRVERTQDMTAALDGADFVIISIAAGGLEYMRHDLEIPGKYGILHTVGDTVGPGGWMRAVRNVPVFYDIAGQIAVQCPDAWVINVSNPLTPLTRVPERCFGIKCIGMCPGAEQTVKIYAGCAGASPGARLDFVVSGIDHGSWVLKLKADGMDVLGKLRQMGFCRSSGDLPAEAAFDDRKAGARAGFRAAFAVWREIGYLPAISDRHSVENWPWFLTSGDEKGLPYGIERTNVSDRRESVRRKRVRIEEYVRGDNNSLADGGGHGEDPVVAVMEALSGGRPFSWTSNYMNIGQIPGFPEGSVVETRCLFDGAGVHPFPSPMPDILKTITLPHVYRQELIIDIALSGSFDELSALIMTDPLCARLPVGRCREMVGEMVRACAPWIRNRRLLNS